MRKQIRENPDQTVSKQMVRHTFDCKISQDEEDAPTEKNRRTEFFGSIKFQSQSQRENYLRRIEKAFSSTPHHNPTLAPNPS